MSYANVKGRSVWGAVFSALLLCGSAPALTITEIMYHPPAGGPDLRFVEVFNDASTVVDLSGWYFANGIMFSFEENTFLQGRSYLVVCADPDAVTAVYGITAVVGPFTGNLDPDGETLEIADNSGVEKVQVSYRDRGKWPSAPKGTGHTLSLKFPYLDPDDGVNWAPSSELGGTPGRVNFAGASGFEEIELIGVGQTWRYKKGTAEFSAPRSAWRPLGFNDQTWLTGASGIGYDDGDDATVLGDMRDGYWSIAMRKAFSVTAAQLSGAQSLVLQMRYDDGFIAYLNGAEEARSFLGNPGEDTPFDAPATSHEASSVEEFEIPIARLSAGQNVLAIQGHNTAIGSTDFSCEPRLVLRRALAGTGRVVLNEVLGRTPSGRWLELFNPGTAAMDIAGMRLTDDPTQPSKYVFPASSSIGPRAFLALNESEIGIDLGRLEYALFLDLGDGTPIVDAHVFENGGAAARAGTSDARFPDGTDNWVYARSPTRGAANLLQVETDLVMNEIMYNPFDSRPAAGQPYEERPGEYIELFNRSAHAIPLQGYAFTRGVNYVFGSVVLGPGEYLVVAQDPAYVQTVYGITALGPWTGTLQNNGETIRLEDPLGNTVDEVKYAEGGDWAELADGDGSSLELIDPRQDNSHGVAWDASDETDKAEWTELSYTGAYQAGGESVFHITPMDEGSFLLDDVEVVRGATNYIPNGDFENGTSPWVMQGALVHSHLTTDEAHDGNACLEVIATSGGDMRVNRLVVPTTPSMPSATYTVRFWARWLYGGNLLLPHGFDNTLARALWLPVPHALGTPGRENTATVRLRETAGSVNLGPIISGVDQRPVRPAAGQVVSVKASVSDADGVQSVQLFYRQGGLGNGVFTAIPAADDGAGADAAAGDGIYTATLPGFNQQDRVLFYLEAADETGASRRYPVDAPAHTLLYQVGGMGSGSLIVYRLALDDDNRGELESRQLHSDDPVYGTFVFEDSEIYYNVGLHYHGSPWNRPGSPRMFKLSFPGDRPLHGARKFNISRYGSAQNEATAYYTIGRSGRPGAPSPHGDYKFVRWELYGGDQGIMSHVETVDNDYVSRWFSTDSDGLLLRANGKITFRLDENWNLTRWAAFQYLGTDKESYRWNWDLHTRTREDEWDPLVRFMKVMDPAQTPNPATFDIEVKKILDIEEMARVLAVRVLHDDWDAVGIGNGQNAYIYYAPIEGRWKYLPWDMDHTYGNPSSTLFPGTDPGVTRLMGRPEFRRYYLQTFQSMLDRTWNVPRLSPILDPTGAAGVGNGDGIKSFVTTRTPQVRASLGANTTFRIRTNGGNDLAVAATSTNLDGDAPLAVHAILLNGEPIENLTWTSFNVWRVSVPLPLPVNHFEFTAFDFDGELAGIASINVTSTVSWNAPTISSVDPPSGPPAGGTTLVIRGTDFHEGIQVRIGSVLAASVELISDSELRAVTAPGCGPVEVRVTNVDGKTVAKADGFSYVGPGFVRGDADGDGAVKQNDALLVLEYMFRAGTLGCLDAADANDDGFLDLADPLRILFHLYAGRQPPAPPHPASGCDPTDDTLGCQ